MSTRKGIKGQKDTPYIYDEVKAKKTIMVTPTAWNILKKKAEEKGLVLARKQNDYLGDSMIKIIRVHFHPSEKDSLAFNVS